jgi:membrane protein
LIFFVLGHEEKMSSWLATLKRTATEFRDDNLSDWAAALTYYGLLALFPALLALVSLVGLFGDPKATTEKVTEMVTALGPLPGRSNRSPPTAAPPA